MDLNFPPRRASTAAPALDALLSEVAAAQAASPTAIAQVHLDRAAAAAPAGRVRDHFARPCELAPAGSFVTGLDGRKPV